VAVFAALGRSRIDLPDLDRIALVLAG